MKPYGGHGVVSEQRRRKTEQDGKVPCHTLARSALDGLVPEEQREREEQERGELQGEHGRPEQQEEACGEGSDHQRAARIVIRAVLSEWYFEFRDEFLSDSATVQFFSSVEEDQVAWIDQHQVEETARDKQQQESAECSAGIA